MGLKDLFENDNEAFKILQQILVLIDEFENIKKEACTYCNELTERGAEKEELERFLNFSLKMKALNY